MKRIVSLILAVLMILPLAACSSSLASDPVENKTTAEEKKTEEKKKETADKEIALPEGFSAGYAMVDITPDVELSIYDASVSVMQDPLYLTCTAVSDGEKVALLMSADVKGIGQGTATSAMKQIEKKYGIPREMIMISATHTHSAPGAAGNSENMTRWLGQLYKKAVECAGLALQDLAPAEAYGGVSHTDSVNFVRRFLLQSGKYQTNAKADQADKPIARESEADNELRTVRLAREGKKDILMMNFQTHYSLYVKAYSADFVGKLREFAKQDMDVNLVYYSGAGGNLNMTAKLEGENKHGDDMGRVKAMWETAKDAVSKEVKLNTGKVVGFTNQYEATVLKDSEERIAQAKEINKTKDEAEKAGLMAKYGFGSERGVNAVITRSGLGETEKIPFTAISFGDIAFTSSPIEQFDANAKWVRDNSPFKMTFSLSLTNGSHGYVPTIEAVPHGTYEVVVSRYVPGSGEAFATEQLRLLNECYHAQ